MTLPLQRTIQKAVTLEGIGVHSGEPARLTFMPAAPSSGVVFRRTDVAECPEIPATLDHVVDTQLGTSIGLNGTRVLTVEHVMAALYAASVDNVVVEIDGPEAPIRDGSFLPYLDALRDAGSEEQDAEARIVSVNAPLHCIAAGSGSSYVATPSAGFRISATIDFQHPAIGRSFGSFEVESDLFRQELAPARTFGFKDQADALHERGLALGASLENAVVLDDEGVLNDSLRFPDEFLRHKVGDLVGDLALIGGRLMGHVVADRPSHSGNVELGRVIQAHARRAGEPVADVTRIMEFLPHRYPMLLIDRIIEFRKGKSIVGIKNVTINEPFFQGHYPGHPIMPGVLILEAMAQCGGLLLMDHVDDPETKVVYFMTMDGVKFRKPVTPGDTLVFELEAVQLRSSVCKMAGRGLVNGQVVAEAEFKARIMDR